MDTREPDVESRRKKLELFINDFEYCLREFDNKQKQNDKVFLKHCYNLHPCFPAIIQTTKKLGYQDQLFVNFFWSMRQDLKQPNVCRNLDDTKKYMMGSAAVIGDFMLPILMPENKTTYEERSKALPHARDLGNAFQLTNMLRDVHEDLWFNRFYMPLDIVNKFDCAEFILTKGGVFDSNNSNKNSLTNILMTKNGTSNYSSNSNSNFPNATIESYSQVQAHRPEDRFVM